MIHYTNILRNAFTGPLPGAKAQQLMSPSIRFTGHQIPDAKRAKNSSVFILLFQKKGEWYIPFIQRPVYNGVHSGQVSLPGGKAEKSDKDLIETAFRETEEEIGIKRESIHHIGTLTTLYIPNSNFMVYPQVGIIHSKPAFQINQREVEALFEAPLIKLLHPSSIKRFKRQINNIEVDAPYFCVDRYEIWGATAMIISEFLQVVKSRAFDFISSDRIKN